MPLLLCADRLPMHLPVPAPMPLPTRVLSRMLQAAEELKIGRTSLKRLCRLHGKAALLFVKRLLPAVLSLSNRPQGYCLRRTPQSPSLPPHALPRTLCGIPPKHSSSKGFYGMQHSTACCFACRCRA